MKFDITRKISNLPLKNENNHCTHWHDMKILLHLFILWIMMNGEKTWSLVCKAGSNWLITSLPNGHNELQLRGGGSICGSANTRYTSLSS